MQVGAALPLRNRPDKGSHFYLNAEFGIYQTAFNHGCGGRMIAKCLGQKRPALLELCALGQHVGHAHHMLKTATGLKQCGLNDAQSVAALRHRRVARTASTRHMHKTTRNYGTAIAELALKLATR